MFSQPLKSPWGKVDICDVLCPGVFMVFTANSGGGIMVSKNMTAVLSPAARKHGINQGGFLCYDEATKEEIVLRELLDKKLWNIPDRIRDKAAYEENINTTLRKNHPEYWRTRRCIETAQTRLVPAHSAEL